MDINDALTPYKLQTVWHWPQLALILLVFGLAVPLFLSALGLPDGLFWVAVGSIGLGAGFVFKPFHLRLSVPATSSDLLKQWAREYAEMRRMDYAEF